MARTRSGSSQGEGSFGYLRLCALTQRHLLELVLR